MNLPFLKSLFSGDRTQMGPGAWPKASLIANLERRYGVIEDIGTEKGVSLYGIDDNGIRFVAVFVHAEGADDAVVEVGFLARFSGYDLSDQALQNLNANLHISVVVFDADGDLYLIGGVTADRPYDETTFSLVLDAWRRDLSILLQSLSGGNMMHVFPAARSEKARLFAQNIAPRQTTPAAPIPAAPNNESDTAAPMRDVSAEENGPLPDCPQNPDQKFERAKTDGTGVDYAAASTLFRRFMGADGPTKSLCRTCGGRGKIGFMARTCPDCHGDGFVRRAG